MSDPRSMMRMIPQDMNRYILSWKHTPKIYLLMSKTAQVLNLMNQSE